MKRLMIVSAGLVALLAAPSAAGELPNAGSVPAAVGPVKSTCSVGEFAIQMAQALQLRPAGKAGHTAESAAWALWRGGVRLRSNLGEPLTEGDLTTALQHLGFQLVAAEPTREVSAEKAAAVISTFVVGAVAERFNGSRSVAGDGNEADDFNNGNGKGGKFKRKGPKSPGGPFPD